MYEHSIFYYPYAFFSDNHVPFLKASALYFDKLYILDPVKSNIQAGRLDLTKEKKGGVLDQIKNNIIKSTKRSSGSENFSGDEASELIDGIRMLERKGILKRIRPEEVLHEYEKEIEDAIRSDLMDPDFVTECRSSGVKRWTLALAKVPPNLRNDEKYKPIEESMRSLMGDFARHIGEGYIEGYIEGSLKRYDEQRQVVGRTYMEGYKDEEGMKEYRFGDYPIELGESIMINHALFGGLLYAQATPVTDDPFHNKILDIKIRRVSSLPEVKSILQNRDKMRRMKQNQLALTTLTDIELGIVPMGLPISKIMEFRDHQEKELKRVREELANLARMIQDTPWSKDFADKLETNVIPTQVRPELEKCREKADSWLASHRGEIILAGGGIISIVLTITAGAPLLIPQLATGVSSILKSISDMTKKQDNPPNGFHYLMKIKEMQA